MKNTNPSDCNFGLSTNSSISSFSSTSTILDTSKLAVTKSIEIHSGISGDCVDYIPTLNSFVIGDQEGYLSLWKYPQWKKISQIKCHASYICFVKYIADSKEIITASYDRTIQIHKVMKDKTIKTLKTLKNNNQIEAMLVLPEENLLISGGPYMGLSFWDLHGYRLKGMLDTKGKAGVGQNILFIEKFQLLACGFLTGQISLYDVTNNFEELSTVDTQHEDWNITIGFDPRYNLLYACVDFHCLKCWRITEERRLEYVAEYYFPGNNILSFEPCELDGKEVILITSVCSRVHVFDVSSKEFSYLLSKNYSRIRIFEQQNILILTSNQDSKIDIIEYQFPNTSASQSWSEDAEIFDSIFDCEEL